MDVEMLSGQDHAGQSQVQTGAAGAARNGEGKKKNRRPQQRIGSSSTRPTAPDRCLRRMVWQRGGPQWIRGVGQARRELRMLLFVARLGWMAMKSSDWKAESSGRHFDVGSCWEFFFLIEQGRLSGSSSRPGPFSLAHQLKRDHGQ